MYMHSKKKNKVSKQSLGWTSVQLSGWNFFEVSGWSFAKRNCPPHQNEECLNRLLERSQKPISVEEICKKDEQNLQVQSRNQNEIGNSSISFSASQMLQKPADLKR